MASAMLRTVILMGVIVLGFLNARAELLSGSYTQQFGGDSCSVWDLSGTYTQTLHGLRLEYTLAVAPDGKFRMEGMVRLHGSILDDDPIGGLFGDHFDGSFYAAGKLKSSGGVVRATVTMKTAGDGVSGMFGAYYKAMIRQTMEVAPELHQLVGNISGKFETKEGYLADPGHFHRTLPVPLSPVEIELPEGMDGSWRLELGVANTGNKLAGAARIELSNGRSHALDLTGKYQSRGDVSNLKLAGRGTERSLGLNLTAQALGEQLEVQKLSGRLLGQKLTLSNE